MKGFSNHSCLPVGMNLAVPHDTAYGFERKILVLLELCAVYAVGIQQKCFDKTGTFTESKSVL